jgi:hypothetical protein
LIARSKKLGAGADSIGVVRRDIVGKIVRKIVSKIVGGLLLTASVSLQFFRTSAYPKN